MFKSRRRKVAAVVAVVALIATGSAIAAWIAWSVTGSGSGKFGNATAVTITFTTNPGTFVNTLGPGTDGDLRVTANNPSTSTATLQSMSVTSATSDAPAPCSVPAGSITINQPAIVGQTIAPGTSGVSFANALHAAATIPVCLAGSNLTVGLTGTAS